MEGIAWVYLAIGAFFLWLASRVWTQPRVLDYAWHWYVSVEKLQETPERFYTRIQQALQSGFEIREVPLKGMGFGPGTLFENRSLFSERHLYLQARYRHATLYLYAAQTPSGLFVAEWLFSRYLTWLRYPVLSWVAAWYFAWQTLFEFDAVLMFGESVHGAVLSVLDEYTRSQELKPLEEEERRPVLHAFYGGMKGAEVAPRRKALPL